MKSIRFLHAADLHLDSPFIGLAHAPKSVLDSIRESTFHALDNLVQTAIEKQVDFVLITGDLFDNEKQSLKAQIRLKKAFELLDSQKIMVYLSYGNHDYIKGNIHPITYPDNVCIFPDEQVRSFVHYKEEQPLAKIYGFSYENRAVTEGKTSEYILSDNTIPFHIAMLHGSIQSNTDHDMYAPFQLSELVEKDFQYWALGHIHQRQVLKETPPVIYPGNIQGRHRKETGEKGCYLVELSASTCETQFVPLQAIEFSKLSVNASACSEIHQLEQEIQKACRHLVKDHPQMVDLSIVGDQKKLAAWEQEGLLEEVIEISNASMQSELHWCHIFRYRSEVDYSTIDPFLYEGDHFIGELVRQINDASIQPLLKDLYKQKQARKYVETLSEEEAVQIKNEAQHILIKGLMEE
ncbi:putative metallophosphoesterase YhaO [Oceanobacillus picturae]|uniref:Metallophosphoesterase YhaO n=1 Tax=Oceanobacillus picturae TaxID=171693 RepID=W9B830_9BACI|nr:DNA repair exonuclease [Oceanobacillus picturae]RIU90648.1 DNA repair exonuclease [Oceanobacillus picturae]CDO02750.1 putative metallophosphoesterase YhaO [Oceanobacillus picturae]